jgi:hypothetical protein
VQYSADAVLLCGDFNLTPDSALYSYISTGALPLHGLDRRGISGQRGPCTATDVMIRAVGNVRHQGEHLPVSYLTCTTVLSAHTAHGAVRSAALAA